ncbi:hypothetical protein [Phytoactinopolyspora limicola]|uniref:hypothetical protein n=1 Tax=Phytoactinopolyspora limicola TaxID=2715536 RepID=UPI00140CEBED|nr:hypothetical protein [Phytoactinopolyspora limicola]
MQEEPTGPVGSAPRPHTDTPGESTGDAAVDEALRTLRGLEAKPVHEHAAVVEQVHRALQDRLADEPDDDTPAAAADGVAPDTAGWG